MNGVDDFLKGNVLAGLLVGVGVVVLAPVVLPVLVAVSRPVAKSAIKTGVILFDKGREAAAEMTEVFEDLVAEARSELEQPIAVQAGTMPVMHEGGDESAAHAARARQTHESS